MMNTWATSEIADLVLKKRRQLKLNQSDMATLFNISRNYYAQIERGEADNISLNVYRDICEWVGVPQHKPDSLNAVVTQLYTALYELAAFSGADAYIDEAKSLWKRYKNIVG
jgi:transcriptional regulator with XRE-family HTH domain